MFWNNRKTTAWLFFDKWKYIDSRFPSGQIHKGAYEIRNCRNRDKSGGGLMEFVKKGIISKRFRQILARNALK